MFICAVLSLILIITRINRSITRQTSLIMANYSAESDVVRQIGHGEAVRAADAYNWQVTMLDDAAQCSRRDA
jgi:hypothetical protein